MRSMTASHTTRALLAAGLTLTAGSASATPLLTLVDDIEVPGSSDEIHEIVSVESSTGTLFATFETGLRTYGFDGTNLTAGTTIDLSGTFADLSDTIGSVSSVAIDPLGRGFGAAAVIPNQSHANLGRVVFFDTVTGATLHTLDAGYHPDMVTFTGDGSRVLIANEGEPVIINTNNNLRALDSDALSSGELAPGDQPGSLSIVDVTGLTTGTLNTATLSDFDFQAANLGAGVAGKLDALRVRAANQGGNEFLDVEPEYVTTQGGKAFVSLQENNAVAVFDFATSQWTDIQDLGAIEQDKVDVSNEDGPGESELINAVNFVKGLPMPDAIASFSVGGGTYYVTANEGDGREYLYDEDGPNEHLVFGDEERMRNDTDAFATFGFANPANEPTFAQRNDNAEYGRLKIIVDQTTDTDSDGDADIIRAFGARSFTIWDESGSIVFDSGETDATDLTQITINAGTYDDGRSDDKGPEPESVEVGTIGGSTYVFVGLERTGGVAMFDVTDPENTVFVDYVTNSGVSPEGLDFFELDGKAYLAVAYEGSEDAGEADIEVYRVVPEPTSLALLSLGGLLIARRRR